MTDETDRPSIEFEGMRYERRHGVWFEARTHMKSTAYVSQRIDISAKKDRTFWERCCDQDFADNPKNRGKVLFKASDLFGDLPDDFEPTNPAQRQAASPKRRSRSGENVKVGFRNRARELVVHCAIEPGWRETGSGWVFQESDGLELPSGHPVRVSARFVEHTFGQFRRQTTYGSEPAAGRRQDATSLDAMSPKFSRAEYELAQGIRLLTDGDTGTFSIKWLDDDGQLNGALPWKQVGRDWLFKSYESVYELPICLSDGRSCVARPFYIELELVLHQPPHAELPPEYAEKTGFASGGLPSLGKRR